MRGSPQKLFDIVFFLKIISIFWYLVTFERVFFGILIDFLEGIRVFLLFLLFGLFLLLRRLAPSFSWATIATLSGLTRTCSRGLGFQVKLLSIIILNNLQGCDTWDDDHLHLCSSRPTVEGVHLTSPMRTQGSSTSCASAAESDCRSVSPHGVPHFSSALWCVPRWRRWCGYWILSLSLQSSFFAPIHVSWETLFWSCSIPRVFKCTTR